MKRNPLIAGVASLLVPGLGQIYCGRETRGAAILAAAIIVGNLNIIFVLLFAATNPDPALAWAYWIPRIGHDLMSAWSILFWGWAVVDAVRLARKRGATHL
jgi:TM2 domain-containing membrane protein YozV